MIGKRLVELAEIEIKRLREFPTPTELNKLHITTLNPANRYNCIYGQMTGVCYSERAAKLIRQCAKQIVDMSSTNGISQTTSCSLPRGNKTDLRYRQDM